VKSKEEGAHMDSIVAVLLSIVIDAMEKRTCVLLIYWGVSYRPRKMTRYM